MNYARVKKLLPKLLDALRCVIHPEIFGNSDGSLTPQGAAAAVKSLMKELIPEVRGANCAASPVCADAAAVTDALLSRMPAVRELLETDIEAAYEGDPAATCREEIIAAYPAFEALSTFLIAHEMYALGVPILPRMMTEQAHSRTGIDIHPGANIGRYFFIDHGTGVVIGETTVIGDRVKLYHSVTLGAKSFEVNPDCSLVKGSKRHPNIGNRVVIYAGATILGGETTIGDDCVIGGNVWLTHSVPAGTKVVAAHERTENL